MALKGNLSDFSLPDVFSLIQLSKKTGVLRIAREGCEGSIWFRDGEVFFATSDWRRELLGQRLVSEGKITPNALERALATRKAEPVDGRRLGTILVDEGYLVPSTLETFVQEQIQDTIFDLMRWDDGAFHFEPLTEIPSDEDIGLSVSVENIVMEGSRRLDEWNRIRRKIPSMDMVFRMSTAPGQGTFEISLKPAEWKLLLALDGARSVAELAEETRRTDFEVARALYGLHSAGLLELAADEDAEAAREHRKTRAARLDAARESGRRRAHAAAHADAGSSAAQAAADEPAFLTSPSVAEGPPVADFDTLIAAAAAGRESLDLEETAEPQTIHDLIGQDREPAPAPPISEPIVEAPLPLEPVEPEEPSEPPPPPIVEESFREPTASQRAPEPDSHERAPAPPSAEFASLIGVDVEGTAAAAEPVREAEELEPLLDLGPRGAPGSAPGHEPVASSAEREPESGWVTPLVEAVFQPRPEEPAESEPAESEAGPELGPGPELEAGPRPAAPAGGSLDEDFSSADSVVLGDELTALTGAERGRRTAPPAPKAPIDAEGPLNRIRRDTRVDRDTIRRIIDGLEHL
jgi:hypothetical protein